MEPVSEKPRFQEGDPVLTLVGTPRSGWVCRSVWHFKHSRFGYWIEIPGKNVARKRHNRRYWDDELELLQGPASDHSPAADHAGSEGAPASEPTPAAEKQL
jgi:hypothetical protein